MINQMRLSNCNAPNPQDDCWRANCDGCPYRRSRVASILQRPLLAATILLVTACVGHDPYATKYPQVALGDNRTRVIDVMGQPDSINSVEVPLLKAEQLAWRAPNKGRVYLVLMVMDRATAKLAVD